MVGFKINTVVVIAKSSSGTIAEPGFKRLKIISLHPAFRTVIFKVTEYLSPVTFCLEIFTTLIFTIGILIFKPS